MSLHIHKFIDLVRATESRGQRDLHMPLKDARDLHADITRLLTTLEDLRRGAPTATQQSQDQIIELEVTGGSFKNT